MRVDGVLYEIGFGVAVRVSTEGTKHAAVALHHVLAWVAGLHRAFPPIQLQVLSNPPPYPHTDGQVLFDVHVPVGTGGATV